jgi:beta-galactosidase
MNKTIAKIFFTLAIVQCDAIVVLPQAEAQGTHPAPREREKFDFGWRFALGHATDRSQDFDPGSNAFSYLAKTGFASGAADPKFDDRGWRELDLPHDWAVEAPFDERASNSHGSKAIGANFPERSVGWYRKTFFVPAPDLGKRISLEFDGVFRDSQVWVNGHYLGREESGYSSFAYNISEVVNYGGENTVVVRVDASLEEGWFYEGAGIYRHVWLVKTAPLHVERHGTFVTSEVKDGKALVTIRAQILNEGPTQTKFQLQHSIVDPNGDEVAVSGTVDESLTPGEARNFTSTNRVDQPLLWSLESPHLYQLRTVIRDGDKVVDRYEMPFGIRTIRFDPNEGFFLNGEHVRLYGTNNHQDHAGVGVAIPDTLQEYRVKSLKEFGCNAYRCSHNPPTPELLDVCDRMGMLVVDENRAMGTSPTQLGQLERMILRDRNHPCVILWSIGNEEWGIEGNEKGERIAATMQALVHRLDPTRPVTVASSGSWGRGVSVPVDVMGFNYYTHGDGDHYHKRFPDKPSIATEEGSTFSTRGVYIEDRAQQHLTAYDENCPDWGALAHKGWGHYADRQHVAGVFIWTGFDYRGEPTPFSWPAISSQFGILDTCGFRKDNSYYYQSQWTQEPVLHLLPHWNWLGKEGQPIRVWAHTNCDEVELLLNDRSLGRRKVERLSHAEWEVPYEPGILLARGFNQGEKATENSVETTGPAVALKLTLHRSTLRSDGQEISMVTVEVVDAEGRHVPTANDEVKFEISGVGRILGVGNGDPSSHEPDQFLDQWSVVHPTWKRTTTTASDQSAAIEVSYDDSDWVEPIASQASISSDASEVRVTIHRGTFERPELAESSEVQLLVRGLPDALVYLNGTPCELTTDHHQECAATLNLVSLREGKNVIAIVAEESSQSGNQFDSDHPAIVKIKTPAPDWRRHLFNGLAQIIVQSTTESGELELVAKAPGLEKAVVTISTTP